MKNDDFAFGLETEFLICDQNFSPLDHKKLVFEQLLNSVRNIPTDDFSTDGLNIKPLHCDQSPYLVEGYYLVDAQMKPHTLLPKGIEIRTPLSQTIERTISDTLELYSRLNVAMSSIDMHCSILSHHPTAEELVAPPNYERHDYWQWALTATTTYGPDINISVPASLAKDIVLADLERKVNHYMPAVCALSFASPLAEGKLWVARGKVGKSIRTYRRSLWAPLMYVHEKPSLRFEFKGFEMAHDLADYQAYFLMSLAVLLDERLTERASDQTRIYELGELAVRGLQESDMRERARLVLESASRTAHRFGLDDRPLVNFWRRLDSATVPADDIAAMFERSGSINELMKNLAVFGSQTLYANSSSIYAHRSSIQVTSAKSSPASLATSATTAAIR